MKWDSANSCPVPGTYKPLNLSGSVVMEEIDNPDGLCFCSDELFPYFKDSELSVDDFFLQKKYRELSGDGFADVMTLLLISAKYRDLEMAKYFYDIYAGNQNLLPLFQEHNGDLPCRLYFCETQEDIWDILLNGIGNPRDFVYVHSGVSRDYPKTLLPEEERGLTYSEDRLKCFVQYMVLHDINLNNILFDYYE